MTEVRRGGLWCHEVLALLDRYLDAELTPDELAQVTEHVADCGVCASFGGAYARTVQALRGLEPVPVGELRIQRLTERLKKEAS